jgi:DNA-directed RNA polymerase subunit H (RpoH/RPB5)
VQIPDVPEHRRISHEGSCSILKKMLFAYVTLCMQYNTYLKSI